MTLTLLQGDVRAKLAELPAESVHCVVTSVPYWGLRDYGTGQWEGGDPACDHGTSGPTKNSSHDGGVWKSGDHKDAFRNSAKYQGQSSGKIENTCGKCGAKREDRQIGLEPTAEAWVAGLVEVFRGVRRVMRADGTLWLNCATSYASANTSASQFPPDLRVPAYDSDGTARPSSPAPDSACPDPCGGSQGETQSHHDRTSGTGQPHQQDASPHGSTGRDSERSGSAANAPGSSPADARASTMPSSPASALGASGLEAMASPDPEGHRSLPAGDPQSADTVSCSFDTAWLQRTLAAHKWDKEPFALACHYLSIAARRWKAKDLILQPHLLVEALQADGWWLRSEIIWHKPNPMPGSQRDRPTTSHEQIFLLTRSGSPTFWTHALGQNGARSRPAPDYYWRDPVTGSVRRDEPRGDGDLGTGWPRLNAWRGHDYFYDEVAVRQPSQDKAGRGGTSWDKAWSSNRYDADRPDGRPALQTTYVPPDATLRDVWTIATEPLKLAHYAAFPREIPRRCIKAGTSEKGVCPECGAPWVRVVETRHEMAQATSNPDKQSDVTGWDRNKWPRMNKHVTTTGWRPTCAHEAEPIPATVLDPFAGSGTTLLVADELQRSAIGIELSPEYAEMARQRIEGAAPLFARVESNAD